MKDFYYTTNCTIAEGEDIQAMIDSSINITYKTFMSHIDRTDKSFLNSCWNLKNWNVLKHDYCVSFHRGIYKNELCYYINHSAIEWIFLKTCEKRLL